MLAAKCFSYTVSLSSFQNHMDWALLASHFRKGDTEDQEGNETGSPELVSGNPELNHVYLTSSSFGLHNFTWCGVAVHMEIKFQCQCTEQNSHTMKSTLENLPSLLWSKVYTTLLSNRYVELYNIIYFRVVSCLKNGFQRKNHTVAESGWMLTNSTAFLLGLTERLHFLDFCS